MQLRDKIVQNTLKIIKINLFFCQVYHTLITHLKK